jgi:hypothetical protein
MSSAAGIVETITAAVSVTSGISVFPVPTGKEVCVEVCVGAEGGSWATEGGATHADAKKTSTNKSKTLFIFNPHT